METDTMFDNNDYLNRLHQQHRQREMMRRAERERLAGQLRAGRPLNIRFYRPALAAVGRWLVTSGTYLQRKSGVTVETSPRRIQPSARGL
jgi:hypothetical protein